LLEKWAKSVKLPKSATPRQTCFRRRSEYEKRSKGSSKGRERGKETREAGEVWGKTVEAKR
jgi:hypothetical protein